MKKALLTLVLASAALCVTAQTESGVTEVPVCKLPGHALTRTATPTEGKRYLLSTRNSELMTSARGTDGIATFSCTETEASILDYSTKEVDESYFWTVTYSGEGFKLRNVATGAYMAELQYDEEITTTDDADKAAILVYTSGESSLIQPDSEGGLGVVKNTQDKLWAGWDGEESKPISSKWSFHDIDENEIYRTEIYRDVTFTMERTDADPITFVTPILDGTTLTLDNLPYLGCAKVTGFGERTRKVDADHTSFTLKGEWFEPQITDKVFVWKNNYNYYGTDRWEKAEEWGYISDVEGEAATVTPSEVWYFDNIRFDRGNYYVTVRNVSMPENYGVTIEASGFIRVTDQPIEFIYARFEKEGYSEVIWTPICQKDNRTWYNLDPHGGSAEGFLPYNGPVHGMGITELPDAFFDNMQTFTYKGQIVDVIPERRETARQTRTPEDFRAMLLPSYMVMARAEYASLKSMSNYDYDSPLVKANIPGQVSSNHPLMEALAAAIDADDETAAGDALAAIKAAGIIPPSADYTPGVICSPAFLHETGIYRIALGDNKRCTVTREDEKMLKLMIVDFEGRNYLYVPEYKLFLNAWNTDGNADGEFGLKLSEIPTPVEFAVWNDSFESGSLRWFVDVLTGKEHGQIVLKDGEVAEDFIVAPWSEWTGNSRWNVLDIADAEVITEARAAIAEANAAVAARFNGANADKHIVNTLDITSLGNVDPDNTDADELDYLLSTCPVHGFDDGVYTLVCLPEGWKHDALQFVSLDFTDGQSGATLANKAFAVNAQGECEMREFVEDDASFNWHLISEIGSDGSQNLTFVHYLPTGKQLRNGQDFVCLQLPKQEYAANYTEEWTPVTTFDYFYPRVGNGEVVLPVLESNGEFHHLSGVQATRVSSDASDAGQVTTISSIAVDDEASSPVYYDLSGRRVSAPARGGIYVERRGSVALKRVL